jgi:hypothetical protein
VDVGHGRLHEDMIWTDSNDLDHILTQRINGATPTQSCPCGRLLIMRHTLARVERRALLRYPMEASPSAAR